MENQTMNQTNAEQNTKFCKHCGQRINVNAVICPLCGCQVEDFAQPNAANNATPNIVINNTNTNTNVNRNGAYGGKPKNKWVSFILCLSTVCGHKFYEGKIGMGILYLFTAGLFGIGWIIDLITLLFKPNPYYV